MEIKDYLGLTIGIGALFVGYKAYKKFFGDSESNSLTSVENFGKGADAINKTISPYFKDSPVSTGTSLFDGLKATFENISKPKSQLIGSVSNGKVLDTKSKPVSSSNTKLASTFQAGSTAKNVMGPTIAKAKTANDWSEGASRVPKINPLAQSNSKGQYTDWTKRATL